MSVVFLYACLGFAAALLLAAVVATIANLRRRDEGFPTFEEWKREQTEDDAWRDWFEEAV